MSRAVFFLAVLFAAFAATSIAGQRAEGCAFPTTPTTYEAAQDRGAFLLGLELAGYNMIRPDDSFFGTPRVEKGLRGARTLADEPFVPPVLLKATGWIESGLTQAAQDVPWQAVGPALISFDCGHGIMQITSGMTSGADNGWPSRQQGLVATHYLFNIGRGAAILTEKWNGAPEVRPVAGTDTDSDPLIVENWYFALWGYNGFTGPGANRSNHPADPIYAWPRTGFSCGPQDDGYGHRYGDYPYQELVLGCASRPPSVLGQPLWSAPSIPYALPNLSVDDFAVPLSLENFVSPYSNMDIPSPRPWHFDLTPRPPAAATALLLGDPILGLSATSVDQPRNDVTIANIGSGILSWRAKRGQTWIHVNKQGGVALGPAVPCAPDSPCERSPTLRITVDAARDPGDPLTGWVDLESLVTGEVLRITVRRAPPPPTSPTPSPTPSRTPTPTATPTPVPLAGDANCQGDVNAIDATVVLQFSAGLLNSLPCRENADANANGVVDPVDAALILQFTAGIISGLPP
jgi:hypothetical protein